VDFNRKPTVKVDPLNHSIAAVSWFADRTLERWATLAGLCLGFALLAGSILWAGFAAVREYRLYRSLAENPLPVLVTITGKRLKSGANYSMEYSFTGEIDGRTFSGKQRMKVLSGKRRVPPAQWMYEEPLRISLNTALALADRQGRALLVKRGLHPLVLSRDEADRILAAAANAASK
jgi:hypothetical protein